MWKLIWKLYSTLCVYIIINGNHVASVKETYEMDSVSFDSLSSHPISTLNSSSASVLWDFKLGLEDWADATNTEMLADVYHDTSTSVSQMRMRLHDGANGKAYVPSPLMHLQTLSRQTFVMRYRYIGQRSTYGKVVLLGSSSLSSNNATSLKVELTFPITGDGQWHDTYAKFYNVAGGTHDVVHDKFRGILTRMYIYPIVSTDGTEQIGETFDIDWTKM